MSSEGDGTKQIKPVSTDLKDRKPMPLGRSEVAGGRTETIHSHIHRTGGHQVDGINPANVHSSKQHYAHPEAAAHRARERSQPYPGKR